MHWLPFLPVNSSLIEYFRVVKCSEAKGSSLKDQRVFTVENEKRKKGRKEKRKSLGSDVNDFFLFCQAHLSTSPLFGFWNKSGNAFFYFL